jgi:predicted Zn-ribbon and HTH transcriptional regulator
MHDLPKTILRQLLTTLNTNKDALSASELALAQRVCHCSTCGYLWMRRRRGIPTRCPSCHTTAWDRPLITAILAAQRGLEQEATQ